MKNNMFNKEDEIKRVKERISTYEEAVKNNEGVFRIGYQRAIKNLREELKDLTSDETVAEAYYRKYGDK